MAMMISTLIDMFCGAGGISHGFEQAGFSVIAGVDSDSVAAFRANHPQSRAVQADLSMLAPEQLGELLHIRPGELDCLPGGPPCQGFSKNRAFRHVDGMFVDDPHNHLYWRFFDCVEYVQPKTVLMENVPEILIKASGYFRDAVLNVFIHLDIQQRQKLLMLLNMACPSGDDELFFSQLVMVLACRSLNLQRYQDHALDTAHLVLWSTSAYEAMFSTYLCLIRRW